MKEILLYVSSILAVSLLFAFNAWRLYGKEALEKFGPELKDLTLVGDDLIKEKKKLGMLAEMFRAIELALISTVIYVACTSATTEVISLSKLFQTPWFQIPLLLASSATVIWCVFLGPWMLMDEKMKGARFWDPNVWRDIRRPYLMWIPYLIGVYYLMGGLIVAVLVTCAQHENRGLLELATSVQPMPGVGLESIQRAALELYRFGRDISLYSQKYVMVSILALIFVVIEQHSYMEKTQFLGSLNLMKSGVVLLLIGTLGVSLGYLPTIYRNVHKEIQSALDEFVEELEIPENLSATPTTLAKTQEQPESPEDLSSTLTTLADTQEQLESHDLRWLFISTISGYANILTLAVIGGSILIRKAFFKEIPVGQIAMIVLPDFMMKGFGRMTETLGIQHNKASDLATPKVDGK